MNADRREPIQIDEAASPEPAERTEASPTAPVADAFAPADPRQATPIDVTEKPPAPPVGCPCCRPGRLVDTAIVAALLDMTEAAVRDAARNNSEVVDGMQVARLWAGIVATRPANSRNYKFWVPEGLVNGRPARSE